MAAGENKSVEDTFLTTLESSLSQILNLMNVVLQQQPIPQQLLDESGLEVNEQKKIQVNTNDKFIDTQSLCNFLNKHIPMDSDVKSRDLAQHMLAIEYLMVAFQYCLHWLLIVRILIIGLL